MSKSTMLRDLKPPVPEEMKQPTNIGRPPSHPQQRPQQQIPNPTTVTTTTDDDIAVNEVLSEINAENKQQQQPVYHPSMFQQQQMLQQQQIQQLMNQQQQMLQQHQDNIAKESFVASENPSTEEMSTHQKVFAYVKHLFTTDNNLLIKAMLLYIVFQYLNIMSILKTGFNIVKLERFFTPLEDNKMIERVLTAFVYALCLVLLKPVNV